MSEETDAAPTMPTETELAEILTHIDRQQPAATKALIDALVARVKVVSATQLIPVFRVHHGHTGTEDDDPSPAATPAQRADQDERPVHAMGEVVGRVGLEPTAKGL